METKWAVLLLGLSFSIYAIMVFLLLFIRNKLRIADEKLRDLQLFAHSVNDRLGKTERDFAYLVDEDLKKERLSVRKQREFQEAIRRLGNR